VWARGRCLRRAAAAALLSCRRTARSPAPTRTRGTPFLNFMRYLSTSPRATERLGFALARALCPGKRGAVVIALDGPLGSGKTTFTRGVFKALGAKGRAVSPTFVLMRRIPLQRGRSLYHIDLYRAPHLRAVRTLELPKLFRGPRNILVIEWARHVARFLPPNAVRISLNHGRKEWERVIIVTRSPVPRGDSRSAAAREIAAARAPRGPRPRKE
jgi:tRNA threonylcarbamoyladenosine biosynthesis protein TsaE